MSGLALRPLLLALLCVTAPLALARQHRSNHVEARAGRFDYYLLTLSWSPTYCLTHGNDQSQCSGKGYGFVLHGLWPQFASGGYPENCATDESLTAAAQSLGQSLYPSPDLMRHEWQAHGTCSGFDAQGYFQLEDRARAVVHIPAIFDAPRRAQSLRADQIVGSFLTANPSLPRDGIVAACSRSELAEVRICLTRNLQPRSCGPGVRNSCPRVPVDVPALR